MKTVRKNKSLKLYPILFSMKEHFVIGAQKIVLLLLKGYRMFISPFLGRNCRFDPCCSLYAQTAIARFGIGYGMWLAVKRILRCHPWHQGGYDPVPKKTMNN